MSVRSKPSREGEAPAEPERDGSELPKGWAMTTIGEICTKPQYGWTSKASRVGRIRYLRTTDISSGTIDWASVPFCEDEPDDVEKYRVRPNDVLVSRAGSVGVSIRVQEVPADTVFASYLIRFNALEGIDPKYLGAFLGSKEYWSSISDFSAGIAVQNVNASKLATLELPLPPFAEQRRIVGKLELLLGKVSSSQQHLSWVPGLLKRFRQSVLVAACSGKLTADWREENGDIETASKLRDRIQSQLGRPLAANEWEEQPLDVPPSWKWVQAEDLCRRSGTITYGVLKPVWVTKGIPTVRVQDMKAGIIEVAAVGHCSPERAAKFSKTSLEVGDLLIAKDGATLGKTAFVPPSLAGGNVTQHVLRFPITPCVAPVFVRFVIDSRHGQEWMRLETKGVALPGVNVRDFRRMPIPLPPLSEQQEIVRRVEKLFAFADQIEARLRQAQAHVDRLTQSLLAKAFRGELVPTEHTLATAEGREYESAKLLLDRISSKPERISTPSSKRRRRTPV